MHVKVLLAYSRPQSSLVLCCVTHSTGSTGESCVRYIRNETLFNDTLKYLTYGRIRISLGRFKVYTLFSYPAFTSRFPAVLDIFEKTERICCTIELCVL